MIIYESSLGSFKNHVLMNQIGDILGMENDEPKKRFLSSRLFNDCIYLDKYISLMCHCAKLELSNNDATQLHHIFQGAALNFWMKTQMSLIQTK